MGAPSPTVGILGAAGLIGAAVASWLAQEGLPVVAIARRFTAAQKASFGAAAVEWPFVGLDTASLATLLADHRVDVVVNCVGVLQDGPAGTTEEVHRRFVERLAAALSLSADPRLLVHVSIPGSAADDRTRFSRSKRAAEAAIAESGVPFVILRPGFVLAPAAYGGSALLRALATLPLDLPKAERRRPFATTEAADIGRTVAVVARRWRAGDRAWRRVWDVMAREPTTLGDVTAALRRHLGGPRRCVAVPAWLLDGGAKAGDAASWLGWSPPIRSTALAELRRGVAGDPAPWIAETGIEPASLDAALRRRPATIQETWFARLYLLKPLILASLVLFWCLSGLIALAVAFAAARSLLTDHGFPSVPATGVTIASSLADIAVGVAIAVRRTCRRGLAAGIVLSLGYMAGAALLAPDLWIEPLGALVKTGPAIVLMLVALAIMGDR
jgi:uncharacterized protein YbjT (DUF2867 family)